MTEWDGMAREQALRKELLDSRDEARKSNALSGRLLSATQEWQHERYRMREAMSQALAYLRVDDLRSAAQVLRDALEE